MAPPPGCRAACVLFVFRKTPHRLRATGTSIALVSDDARSSQRSTLSRVCLRGTCPARDPFAYREVSLHLEKTRRECVRRWAARTPLP
jgi:hypothetical protein